MKEEIPDITYEYEYRVLTSDMIPGLNGIEEKIMEATRHGWKIVGGIQHQAYKDSSAGCCHEKTFHQYSQAINRYPNTDWDGNIIPHPHP